MTGAPTHQTYSTRRMEALTDGVFAIAMTLLVLDIKATDFGNITKSSQLIAAFSQENIILISFVVSFLMLGSLWAVHARQFEYIVRTDRRLMMLNTLRLLAVVFIPLTMSLSSTYGNVVLARVLLPLNFLVILLLGIWQWRYALASPHHLTADVSPHVIYEAKLRNVTIAVLAVFVTILAIFIQHAAFLLLLSTPIFMELLKRYHFFEMKK